MKALRGCLLALGIYALLAAAITFAVERRIGQRQPAVIAGVIAGFVAWVALSYLLNVEKKFGELRLIWGGMKGAEPRDGARFAAIGPITPTGRALVSPITHTPAVAYVYKILTPMSAGRWEGVALVPSTIRCGANAIRLLALPELDFRQERMRGEVAARNAADYIRNTEFLEPDRKDVMKAFKEFRSIYSDDDGAVRQDVGKRGEPPPLDRGLIIEQVVKPGETVCAFGRYSAERGGLVVDPNAPAHSVKLTKGSLIAPRVLTMITNFIAGTVLLAGVAAALGALYAVIPLDVVAAPSWAEVQVEEVINERVRPRLAAYASLLPIIPPEVGDGLQSGEARGRIRTARGEAKITRVRAERTEVFLLDGESEVAVLTLTPAGELRELKLLSEEVKVPPSRFVFRRISDSEIAGRLGWASGGVHAVFRVHVAQLH